MAALAGPWRHTGHDLGMVCGCGLYRPCAEATRHCGGGALEVTRNHFHACRGDEAKAQQLTTVRTYVARLIADIKPQSIASACASAVGLAEVCWRKRIWRRSHSAFHVDLPAHYIATMQFIWGRAVGPWRKIRWVKLTPQPSVGLYPAPATGRALTSYAVANRADRAYHNIFGECHDA